MANRSPFGLALAFQREATRQGQRTVEQGLDARRTMTEAFVRNVIGMGRVANRNATETARQGAVAYAGLADAMVPGGADARTAVERGFDSVAAAQEDAWRIFEESAGAGLAAYVQLAESGMATFVGPMDVALEAPEVGSEASDAAVEYERQRPEEVATGRTRRRETGREVPAAQPREIEPADADEEVREPSTVVDDEVATEPGVEAAGDEPATREPEAGPPLQDISGIGDAYAERLRAAGIETVAQLRDADVAALSTETDIQETRLSNWQQRARDVLGEE